MMTQKVGTRYSESSKAAMVEIYKAGVDVGLIARAVGCHVNTVLNAVHAAGVPVHRPTTAEARRRYCQMRRQQQLASEQQIIETYGEDLLQANVQPIDPVNSNMTDEVVKALALIHKLAEVWGITA